MSLERGLTYLVKQEVAIREGNYNSTTIFAEPRPLGHSLQRFLLARDRARRNDEKQRLYYRGPARPRALSWEVL